MYEMEYDGQLKYFTAVIAYNDLFLWKSTKIIQVNSCVKEYFIISVALHLMLK